MNYLIIMLMVFVFSGCGASLRSNVIGSRPSALVPSVGMTRAEVSALMARKVLVGYEADPANNGALRPIEVNSLYSTEFLTVGEESFLVDSYITGILQTRSSGEAGRVVAESGLTPMIFRNNILVGQGREALTALKNKCPDEK